MVALCVMHFGNLAAVVTNQEWIFSCVIVYCTVSQSVQSVVYVTYCNRSD